MVCGRVNGHRFDAREGAREDGDEVDKLTKADRGNARKCAARFSHGFFHPPASSPWLRDGKMSGVTEDMLTHLLAEVYSVAYDSGKEDAFDGMVDGLRARGDEAGRVLADVIESGRSGK